LRAQRSGLGQLLEKCTFAAYTANEPWQKAVKAQAESYANNSVGWFSMNGSSGAGKTHLCTAIVSALISSGKEARYFVWPDEIRKVKAKINDEYAEDEIMQSKTVEVLYIDDFLKTGDVYDSNAQRFVPVPPTAADIRLAFEIVNYRSNNNLITIFSSERTLEEINKFDYALGSRICQMCGENYVTLTGDKNYRMR
jgi:DNA replication protein DnaC